ncbi:trigger factor [Aquariibacter albus]|uniref:Trigger factor n=1 Tax=Aquariibacter albus TaxID=2759899 RepID=A0A839HUE6_9BURK|nr:trigger factor [Aquariibacter albus]MBB1161734.1 trigger factor [Aquariibacter albus]
MAVTVETLDKLERRITLSLSAQDISTEVEQRLKRLARTVKADGFRPGKVPMSVVAQRYGMSVQYEVVNDKVGEAFAQAASEAQLRVAGAPRISEKEGEAPEGQLVFDAVFEVYPEVQIEDLAAVEVSRASSEIDEAAIDRTVEILRKQRRSFAERAEGEVAVDDDRVTIDFEGKVDGVAFPGGTAEGFQFLLGEGRMLPSFEDAVRGMKVGESKTFPLTFPEDYHGKDVAGKEADFLVTVKKIEAQQLPEITEDFVKSLGVADGSIDSLRADIRKNLEREIKARLASRNKSAAFEALLKASSFDLPQALVANEVERMVQSAMADLKERGVKDAAKAGIPAEVFQPQAERRVRLGLMVAELVKRNNLQATPDQIRSHIEEIAQSYERPEEVIRWYMSDRGRMAEVEALVIENNVLSHLHAQAKVSDEAVPFEALMQQPA